MPITIVCVCGRKLKAKDEASGRTAICPECGERIKIPAVSPVTSDDGHTETPSPSSAPVPAQTLSLEEASHHEDAVKNSNSPITEPAESDSKLDVSPQHATARAVGFAQSVVSCVAMYRWHRHALLRALTNRLPARLIDGNYQWRRIEVDRNKPIADCRWDNDHWTVSLPTVCATCGYTKEVYPHITEFDAIDAARPVRALLIAALCIPALVLLGNRWLALAYILALPLVLRWGVLDLRTERVHMKYSQCSDHQKSREWPQVSLDGNILSVVAGHVRVRKHWLRDQRQEPAAINANEFRKAIAAARTADATARERIPRAAYASGWIWLMTARLQWFSAVLEFLAVLAFQVRSGPDGMSGVAVFLVLYVMFRFRVAEAFRAAGEEILNREASDTLSHGTASIGIGLFLVTPIALIFFEIGIPGLDTSLWLTDPVPRSLLISLLCWGILLILAGLLALIGRSAYLGQTRRRKKPIIDVPCCMCRGSYSVMNPSEVDSLVICQDCGEAFRLTIPEA